VEQSIKLGYDTKLSILPILDVAARNFRNPRCVIGFFEFQGNTILIRYAFFAGARQRRMEYQRRVPYSRIFLGKDTVCASDPAGVTASMTYA
jgi:hypothetical protein